MQQKMEETEPEKDQVMEEKTPPGKKTPDTKTLQAVEKKPPGKINLFLKKTARMLLIAILLFAAGMITSIIVLQRPQAADLNSQVEQLTGEKTDLEEKVASLETTIEKMTPFEGENKVLRASLSEEQLHVRVLSALKDVQSAQLALALGEADAARLSLSRTEDRLVELGEMLPGDQQGVVDGMSQRLDLVLEGMDGDIFAAQSDLQVLANSLLQLENTLFVDP